ncbi:D-tyrosyl-tRNA(Tyr) deacylase [Christensenellaceae bacterium OttesenSCG-928-L17]|nr:D-tyrosyl-tRNA(Tyr) deacylase [Christensenellaceae bacterium OttesenSCG-928-L17]
MRAVVQRVKNASVTVGENTTGSIGQGLLVFLGVEDIDEKEDLQYICDKIAGLRIFEDAGDKLNLSVVDVGGSVLLVSQFTLYGDARKGRRPSFIKAARPEKANAMYEQAVEILRAHVPVETGEFQAIMQVSLVNDGPVTILLDSKKVF